MQRRRCSVADWSSGEAALCHRRQRTLGRSGRSPVHREHLRAWHGNFQTFSQLRRPCSSNPVFASGLVATAFPSGSSADSYRPGASKQGIRHNFLKHCKTLNCTMIVNHCELGTGHERSCSNPNIPQHGTSTPSCPLSAQIRGAFFLCFLVLVVETIVVLSWPFVSCSNPMPPRPGSWSDDLPNQRPQQPKPQHFIVPSA